MDPLARQLREALDDLELWQVYGDQLQEAGDPTGEMIAWSIALARTPSARTAECIRVWMDTHVPWAQAVSHNRLEAVLEPVQRRNLAGVELAMGHARHLYLQMQGEDSAVVQWWSDLLPEVAADSLLQFVRTARLDAFDREPVDAFLAERWPLRALTMRVHEGEVSPRALLGSCPELQGWAFEGFLRPDGPVGHQELLRLTWMLPWHPDEEPEVAWLLDAALPRLELLQLDHRLHGDHTPKLERRFGSRLRWLDESDQDALRE